MPFRVTGMPGHETTFKHVGIAAIVLLMFGLGGWYFFISRQTTDIEGAALSRGFSIGVPSFSGSRGSTAENIESGFGTPLSGEQNGEAKRPPRLWRVSTTPVAGAGFVSTPGSTTILRFVERSTGHIFDADPRTSAVTRRTNKLIPKVYDALVGSGDSIIERSLNAEGALSTFTGTLGTTTEDGFVPLLGADLGSDVRDIALLKSSDIVFLMPGSVGTQLVRTGIDGSKSKPLLSLFVSNFKIAVTLDERITLIEKTASGIPGNAYEVGNGGVLAPLVRNIPGLTILPRTGSSALLIGTDTGESLFLSLRTSKEATLTSLPIKTIADKCVWVPGISLTAYCAVPLTPPGANFLTNWYRGTVHTNDSWFKVEGGAGTAESFFTTDTDTMIDVERPLIDETGNYIAFMNARDKSLWILRINE